MIALVLALSVVVGPAGTRDVDGDTLIVAGERIRIAGINAADPVAGHSCTMRRRWRFAWCDDAAAAAATAYARDWLERARTPVVIRRYGCDRYGRTIADVAFAGRDFGKAMVAAGHARRVPTTWIACR
ncbi:MAG: thermonuclease family protein [Sphingomonadaceae bacterium]|nr:thermonuclease family protein [Sphingomonadaceae bacterium]